MNKFKQGFTLIELLIVIAILGTLAVVVLLALNPVQQLARTRDAGRVSTVTQLGHALEAFATQNGGVYLTPSATWISGATASLVAAGEISQAPTNTAYTAGPTGTKPSPSGITCPTNANGGYCYQTYVTNSRAIIFAPLESGSQNARCTGNNVAWAVYSTTNGSGGVVCTASYATAPADPGATGYVVCATTPCGTNLLIR